MKVMLASVLLSLSVVTAQLNLPPLPAPFTPNLPPLPSPTQSTLILPPLPTPRSPTPPPTPKPTLTPTRDCFGRTDVNARCMEIGYIAGCVSESYGAWMESQCSNYCCKIINGLAVSGASVSSATTSATSTVKIQDCSGLSDTDSRCATPGFDSNCGTANYGAWMQTYCPKLCCQKAAQMTISSACTGKTDVSTRCTETGFAR